MMRQELVCNGVFGVACLRGNLFEYLMHYSPAITHALRQYVIEFEKHIKIKVPKNNDIVFLLMFVSISLLIPWFSFFSTFFFVCRMKNC